MHTEQTRCSFLSTKKDPTFSRFLNSCHQLIVEVMMYYQTESQGMQLAEKIKATRIKCVLSGEPVAKAVPVLGKFKTGSRAGVAAAAELKQLASVANTKFPNLQTQLGNFNVQSFNYREKEKEGHL